MMRINSERLLADLETLSAIGRTAEGGVSRPAMSSADIEGRAWFRQRVEQSGLDFRQDGAANLSAVLPSEPVARTVLLGSHLDTVPNGGKYDGALGVLSALEVLRTIREAGLKLPFNLEAISFTDEEGTAASLFGSRAAAGMLAEADFLQPRGGAETLRLGMERLGITPETVLNSRRNDILAYYEIHIEQGLRLEDHHIDLGVVSAIVGIRSFWIRLIGKAAHAGAAPMNKRADALWGLSTFLEAARRQVTETFSPGVMNVGQVQVQPGGFNVVPAEALFTLEFRHGSTHDLDEMESTLRGLIRASAQSHGLGVEIQQVSNHPPVIMDEHLCAQIEQAANSLGLQHTRLLSFAGHDAQSMSAIAPSAMIFVPSHNGISHNPVEYTSPEHVISGANVLLQTVLGYAQGAAAR